MSFTSELTIIFERKR